MSRINGPTLAALALAFFLSLAPPAAAQVPQPAQARQEIALGLYRAAEATANKALQQLPDEALLAGVRREWLVLLAEIYYRSRQYAPALNCLQKAEQLLDRQRQLDPKSADAFAGWRLELALWRARVELARAAAGVTAAAATASAGFVSDDIPAKGLTLPQQADRLELLVLRAQLADLREAPASPPDRDRRWSLLRRQAETLWRQTRSGAEPSRGDLAGPHASVLFSLARCYEREGCPEQAVEILRAVALPPPGETVNPRVTELRAETAKLLHRAGRFTEESHFWQEVLNTAQLRMVASNQGPSEIERLNVVAGIHCDRAEARHLAGDAVDAVKQELDESEKCYRQAIELNQKWPAHLQEQATLDAMKTVSRQGLLRIRLAPGQWNKRLECSFNENDIASAVKLYDLLKATRIDGDPSVHHLEATLGAQYLGVGNIGEAKKYLRTADEFFQTYRPARATQVQLLVLLAEIDRFEGCYREAESRLEKAAGRYDEAGLQDANLKLWIKVHRGRVAAACGKFSVAEAHYQGAIRDAEAAGSDAIEAGNLARLGLAMLYKGINRLDKAEVLCRNVLTLKAAQDPKTSDPDAERALLPCRAALAGILLLRNKLDDARPMVGAALRLAEDQEIRTSPAGCEIRHLAAMLDFLCYKSSPAESRTAEDHAANAERIWQALRAFEQTSGRGPEEAQTCYYLSQLSCLRWQRQVARDAARFRAYKDDLDKFDRDQTAYQETLQRFAVDERRFRQEKELWSAKSPKERRDEFAQLDAKWTALDKLYKQLTSRAKELNDRKRDLESRYDNLGKISPEMLFTADDLARQATTLLEASRRYPNLQYVALCHRASILRARAAWEPERAREAVECLEHAVALLEHPCASLAEGDISPAELLSQYASAYDQLIQWHGERNEALQALVYAERSRAFLDWIRLRVFDPDQAQGRAGLGRIVTRDEVQRAVQNRLRAGELWLYYHLGTPNSYLFVIGLQPAPQLFRLQGDDPRPDLDVHVPAAMVAHWVDDYLDLISQQGHFPKASADDKQRCAAITDGLLPRQVRKRIVEQQGMRTLVVSPHGALERLPFEALWVHDGESTPPQFLIDYLPQTAITYAPSLMILDALAEASHQQPRARSVVTVGCSDFHEFKLPKLEAATTESNKVLMAFGRERACQLVNGEATKANLRLVVAERRPAGLHFATHRVAMDGYGGAALVLRPGMHPTDPSDNGLLTIDEICHWSLDGCELAVVNACRVNEGGNLPGEISMSFAFLTAGARRVVASQWLVADQAGGTYVGSFLAEVARQWKTGEPCNYAAAMITARQDLRRQRPADWGKDPFYWANFILIGPASDLRRESQPPPQGKHPAEGE